MSENRFVAADDVTLRRLRSDDAPLIGEFYASLSERDKYFFYPHPLDDEHAVEVAATAEDPGYITLLATVPGEDGETMIGYAWIRSREGAAVWWFGICVRPGWQERRIGTRLLSTLLDQAREAGVRKVGLHVHCDNVRGRSLYTRHGFEIVGESINQQQNVPQYVMEVTLD